MAALKIGIVVMFMTLLIARKMNIGATLLLGAVVSGILGSMTPVGLVQSVITGAIGPESLRLVASLYLVLVLGSLMHRTNGFGQVLDSLKEMSSDRRVSLAVVPAAIGLLPVVGGAMLSAPLIGQIGGEMGMSSEQKTFVNYWFRHVWEYAWPLYPSLILAAGILQVPVYRIAAVQLPVSAFAIVAGVVAVASWSRKRGEVCPRESGLEVKRVDRSLIRRSLVRLAVSLSPIIVVAVVSAAKVELWAALVVSIASLLAREKAAREHLARALWESLSPGTVVLLLGAMVFREVFSASGLAQALPETFRESGVPPGILIFFLPFLLGLMTGLASAFVGVTFPVLIHWLHPGSLQVGTVIMAYVAGYAGVLFSPVHLCLILSNEYFKADLSKVYRMMARPLGAMMAGSVLFYAVFH
ncbi:MAG: DUF401 family protein [Firmicutes bacterium]|nr:DUF401 family protein [Bacillota bacterium]